MGSLFGFRKVRSSKRFRVGRVIVGDNANGDGRDVDTSSSSALSELTTARYSSNGVPSNVTQNRGTRVTQIPFIGVDSESDSAN